MLLRDCTNHKNSVANALLSVIDVVEQLFPCTSSGLVVGATTTTLDDDTTTTHTTTTTTMKAPKGTLCGFCSFYRTTNSTGTRTWQNTSNVYMNFLTRTFSWSLQWQQPYCTGYHWFSDFMTFDKRSMLPCVCPSDLSPWIVIFSSSSRVSCIYSPPRRLEKAVLACMPRIYMP